MVEPMNYICPPRFGPKRTFPPFMVGSTLFNPKSNFVYRGIIVISPLKRVKNLKKQPLNNLNIIHMITFTFNPCNLLETLALIVYWDLISIVNLVIFITSLVTNQLPSPLENLYRFLLSIKKS